MLPSDTRSLVEDQRSALDRMVLLASLAVLFPPAAVIVAAATGTSWRATAIAVAIAVLVAVAAYRGAVSAAVAFGDVVRSCFDNYRRALLGQLGFALPGSLAAERKLWGALKQQLYQRGTSDPSVLVLAAAENTQEPAAGDLGEPPGAPGHRP